MPRRQQDFHDCQDGEQGLLAASNITRAGACTLSGPCESHDALLAALLRVPGLITGLVEFWYFCPNELWRCKADLLALYEP